mmetsp:Transcript_37074/g.59528  ORF Transcript_37074/g.59528 Transcript_37074/m.59528 type:complete len:117 (-) Transcript_37074:120-470(-)
MPLNPSAYLQKFGWSKGDGLGKNSTGIKTFVKVSKRERDDMTGIGTSSERWNHASKFDSMFAAASAKYAKKSKKKKKKKKRRKDEDESSTSKKKKNSLRMSDFFGGKPPKSSFMAD